MHIVYTLNKCNYIVEEAFLIVNSLSKQNCFYITDDVYNFLIAFSLSNNFFLINLSALFNHLILNSSYD